MEALNYIIFAIYGLSGLAVCYLISLCGVFLRKKAKQIREAIPLDDNIVLGNLFDCANNVITKTAATSVRKFEQVIGGDLRRLIKEGKADKNELIALAEGAYKEVLEIVSPEILNDIKTSIDNSELYIRNVIEAELLKLKAELGKG